MHRFIHKSLSDTPTGQYTSCRILYRRIADQCAEKMALYTQLSRDVTNNSAAIDPSEVVTVGKDCYLLQSRKDELRRCLESLEEKVTPEAYADMLRQFSTAYRANEANWTANDRAHFEAILELQRDVKNEAAEWNAVSGSVENAWIESMVKTHELAAKLMRADPKLESDPLAAKAQEAVHAQLSRDHDKERARSQELAKSIDTKKAQKTLQKQLKELAAEGKLKPKAVLRRAILKMIWDDLAVQREERRADRREAIQTLVDNVRSRKKARRAHDQEHGRPDPMENDPV